MYMHPLVCQRLQHEWWMCFTCYSEESLNPPNPPAAGHPPGVFVHCGAADAMLTAHWTDRNGLLKHTQSIPDTVFSISLPFSAPAKRKETTDHSKCQRKFNTVYGRLSPTQRSCRYDQRHLCLLSHSTCSSQLVPTSRDGRGLQTGQRPLLKNKKINSQRILAENILLQRTKLNVF